VKTVLANAIESTVSVGEVSHKAPPVDPEDDRFGSDSSLDFA
jgi:hypothetical protein